jgi:hypothetical protein
MDTARIPLPVLLLLAAAVAGCAGDKPAAADAEGATETTGILQGIVVDDAIRPVAGVAIQAAGNAGAFNASTGADGLFRIAGLPPGSYLVEASKPRHTTQRLAVDVRAGVDEPELARFELTFEAASVPYANVYKYDGFYECGLYSVRVCANVNIATWIVVCANTGVCAGNVTGDHSVFFQGVEPGLDFIQTEMSWSPTSTTGESLAFLIGGGTEAELREGVGLPAYNATQGPSPLMLRISNHEAEDSWCHRNEQCETTEVLNESKLGTERALLVQVDTGPWLAAAPSCGVPGVFNPEPCGVGAAVQQPYTMFTITFHGYEPPVDWLFATTGQVPPPPA